MMTFISMAWIESSNSGTGIFSSKYKYLSLFTISHQNPLTQKITYTPSDYGHAQKVVNRIYISFEPHIIWVDFFAEQFRPFCFRHTREYCLYFKIVGSICKYGAARYLCNVIPVHICSPASRYLNL